MAKTAALYARFSSDLQKDRSIDDQYAVCERLTKNQNLKIVARYSDRAKSGAVMLERDGLLEMMTAAKAKQFDHIVVESLDRLSRDQADLPLLFKKLSFYGVKIITLEGETTDIHVGIRGITNPVFLRDLANKVRRGHEGQVREGKMCALPYGYRVVPGKPNEREIDPIEAATVRRIFQQYADGMSPRAIAAALTRDGIARPNGTKDPWSHQAFIGADVQGGMLKNRIYVGEIVWNKQRNAKDPDTQRRVKRAAPIEDRVISQAPHLRIIDDVLWNAVQKVRTDRAVAKGVAGRLPKVIARTGHLLSGLLRCGACEGSMRIQGSDRTGRRRIVCATAYASRVTCDHGKGYFLDTITARVVQGFCDDLRSPDKVIAAAKAWHAARAERERKAGSDLREAHKRLARVTAQIDRLVEMIMDPDGPPTATLKGKLRPLEIERADLAERVTRLEANANVVSLHPKVLDDYTATIDRLADALAKRPDDPATHAAIRKLIEAIIVHPTEDRADYEIEVKGRLDALLGGVNLFPTTRSTDQIIAEEGISVSLHRQNRAPGLANVNTVVSFGRWRAAA